MLAPRALTLALALLSLAVGTQAAAASDRVGSRIVNGEAAPAGAWPSIAQLSVVFTSGPNAGTYACGGTLIAPTVIQTAAHCLTFIDDNGNRQNAATGSSVARVGVIDRLAATTYAWTSYSIHPNYDDANVPRNDIALIQLASAPSGVPSAPLISPWFDDGVTAEAPGFVAGWGRTIWNVSTLPRYLMQADVPIVGDDQCASIWPQFVSASMLCAGAPPTTRDTCGGDSGGPLSMSFDGSRYVVGTTSWGAVQCGNGTTPGVYGRISALRPWVLAGTTAESTLVRTHLQGTTAQPANLELTNAGADVTARWTVDAANWTTSGFSVTLDGVPSTVTTAPSSVTRRITSGGEVQVSVQAIVSLGTGGTTTFTGTPTPTRAPIVTAAISGVAKVGETLTATGSSDDPWAPTVSFQWLRDGTPIAGATAATYTTSSADIGKTLSARATATNAAGTGEALATTAKIAAAPSVRVTTTKTLGLRRQGGVLHVTTPTATGYPTPKVTYQWQRDGKSIRKATKSTYRLTAADRGKKVRVRITYRNAEGRAEVRSASVTIRRTTTAFLPVPITRRVSISGTAKVGQRLRVTAPPAAGYTTPTTTYRWLRNGKPIGKATRNVYRLTAADRNRTISVRISYGNSVGTTTLTTRGVRVS